MGQQYVLGRELGMRELIELHAFSQCQAGPAGATRRARRTSPHTTARAQ